jgi:hypothetical protein
MRAPSPDASERVDLSQTEVPLAHGGNWAMSRKKKIGILRFALE